MDTHWLLAQAAPQASDPWAHAFFGLDPGQRFAMLIVAIGCVTGIVITIVVSLCGMLVRLQRQRVEAELKREMLDRGMTAEEIARVVESSQPKDFLERWASGQREGAT